MESAQEVLWTQSVQGEELAKSDSIEILDSAYRIHSKLGPGLFESVYEAALAHELTRRGLNVSRQFPIPVIYESIQIEAGFQADLLVEGKVIVELKSIEAIAPVHHKQLLTYLRLSNTRLGLLLNFNVPRLKEGIIRMVNQLPEDQPVFCFP